MSRLRFFASVAVLVPALVGAACSKGSAASETRRLAGSGQSTAGQPAAAAQQSATAAQTPAEPVKPVPAELPAVLARVNGEEISKAEFERAVRTIEQRAGGPVPADRRDQIFRGLLDQLVGVRLLRQEVAARHVEVPDAEVDARIDALKKQVGSEDAFKQALTAQNMTLDRLRTEQRADLGVGKMLEAALKDKVTATPDQVITFYKENPDRFKQGERVKASHILLSVPQGADAAAKAQVKAKAEEILKQAKAGKDFAALAKEHSQDPGSAINGGDLGFFGPGQMVGPFNDVAFKLAPGTISDLVETQFGFHIIKVVEKQDARTVPLDDVKDQVKQYLENVNKQRETTAFVAGLRAKGKVEILV